MAQKKAKMGRPKLPKGEAKGRIVPVRFKGSDLKAIEAAARAKNQTVSEWVRSTIYATLTPRKGRIKTPPVLRAQPNYMHHERQPPAG